MTPDRAELLARVLAFDIDGGDVALPFAARLARENGWSRRYAERVVEEYKRFAFLATECTVCPSEDVDAAWHLHLTYTRSYWQRFCGEVLGRPLHHDPTRGGPAEGEKHLRMYADTLAAYQRAFGRPAPADVWPAAAERFGTDTRHRSVNTARNWVIPKAPVKRAAVLTGAFAVAAVLVPGCDGGLDPFAMGNSAFLFTLALALIGAVCVGRVLRSALRTPNPAPADDTLELDWEQTAYLAGGAGRLATAAIARVVGRGLARVDDDARRLVPSGPVPADASAVEGAVLRALPVTNEATALKPLEDAVGAAFAKRAEQMERDGLTLSKGRGVQIVLAALVPLALVLVCLAVPRLLTGLEAKKPVGYLAALTLVGGGLGFVFVVAGSLRLSNRGRALLERQKARHAALRSGAAWGRTDDAGMAVALYGTEALAGSPLAPLQPWYPRQTTEAAASGCSTGCGSGCSSNSGSSDAGGGGDGDGGGGGSGCGGGCGGGGD